MTNVLAWLISLVFASIAFRRTWEFRAGRNRDALERYRDKSKPAFNRHSPLVMPYVSAVVIVVLLLGALAYIQGWPGSNPTRADGYVVVAIAGSLFAFFGFATIATYRPPKWLVPGWLLADDEQSGYVRPEPDWFDRLWLLIGYGLVGVAFLTVIYGVTTIAG